MKQVIVNFNRGNIMSTPASATTNDSHIAGESNFQSQVNDIVSNLQIDDYSGEAIYPDDLDEPTLFAVRTEKRRRDTQSALAKTKSALAVASTEKDRLAELYRQSQNLELTAEQRQELADLQESNPEAWRQRVNELEAEAVESTNQQLETISTEAQSAGELGEREILLNAFHEENPGLTLSDDVLQNDIPPRITNKLKNGKITFKAFLGEVKEYLTSGKVISDTPVGDEPNLSSMAGGSTAGEASQNIEETVYEDAIF